MSFSGLRLAFLVLLAACAAKQTQPDRPLPKPNIDPGRLPPAGKEPTAKAPEPEPEDTLRPMVPAEVAYAHGWMPLSSTGVDQFLRTHPTYDGRNVVIGILDTGIDPGIPGLEKTSTGDPKILDLRDFSDEGAVPLQRVTPTGDSVEIAGRRFGGFGRVTALNTNGPYYGGTIREIPLGDPPASDLNANGRVADTLAVLVTRATDGWVLFADTDGDRSFAGERPVHDYLVARETFGWAAKGRKPRLNLAANFSGTTEEPHLDLVFDISSHGSHVSGIAAGHDLYGVAGFDGVAPGAQLLGLKIANSAQGSITTTGSMLRAIDYAIRFANARHLPLVLNMSFGVGNEIEGTARIDAMVDSVLAANPTLAFTISAGNDGPGLSTVGFPGSARRAISIGATLPASFLSSSAGGAREDQLAYFSSRGGELAKPDIVTPGVAYSSVPRWSTGQEIEQGTSMASPHAAGLAALLVSALAQEKHPIDARAIKQALMVTARPLPRSTFLDEGTGLPEVEAAYRWLIGERPVPEVMVRVVGGRGWTTAAFHEAGPKPGAMSQKFELVRPAPAPPASYTLRSEVPWISAPARVTLSGPRTIIELRYDAAALKEPGASVGTVSGWGPDSLAGPAFRLVSTVIVPAPVRAGAHDLRSGVRVEAGSLLRTFFRADSARPMEVQVSPASIGQKGLAFLHEPDGMPYREESVRPVGAPQGEAVYQIDARDVVQGTYEADALAPAAQALSLNLRVIHSPLLLRLAREKSEAVATLSNTGPTPVEAELAVLLGGAERVETVVAKSSAVRRIPFIAPAWARSVVVDVTMSPEQWGRFTDFGVTLFDSIGRQIEKQPLNYAFGRLQAKLPDAHGDMPVELGLFPGFADTTDQSWSLRASIRLYADSAVALKPVARDSVVTVGAGKTATARFTLPEIPWPLGDGFFPLGVLAARSDEHTWTRESGLPLPNPPMMR
ncbi:MAG: S8 family serine peptidase [Gemmatimonadales bacterium]